MKRRRENPFIIKVPKKGPRQLLPSDLAANMLVQTQMTYAEIAKACGYEFPENIENIARRNHLREFSPNLYPWGPNLKAITVMQPYAELIKRGVKRVENRSWPIWKQGSGLVPSPKHPITLLIHAGASKTWWRDDLGIRMEECAWGAAVCLVQIVGSVKKDEIPEWVKTNGPDRFGWLLTHEHAVGSWCWILEDVVPLLRPVPLRGNQGIWEAPAEKINPAAPLCPEHKIPFCRCPKLQEILKVAFSKGS